MANKNYHHLYNSSLWKNDLRINQLKKQPFCERCLSMNKHTIANVVNHIKPHRGDWRLFADADNLQSMCKPCHDGPIQSNDLRGYDKSVGDDGWPIDDKHPLYKRR